MTRPRAIATLLLPLCLLAGGCNKEQATTGTPPTVPSAAKVSLTLDWVPEPEFGGFYAARLNGAFARNGIDIDIRPAGQGATWQLVDQGKTDFATTSADQVLIARSQGADVVALFAVYQTAPQGIMVHKARGFTKLDDVFANAGTLEAEDASWLQFLNKKFGQAKVKLTGNTPGIVTFLAKPDLSKQCFVTSEPLLAKRQNSDPQTFLIADAGFNPYTTVVIGKGSAVRGSPDRVKGVIAACREGWRAYLDDPAAANAEMGRLNKDMDAATFLNAAKAQAPLIETDDTRKAALGVMTAERWKTLGLQLLELKVISAAPTPEDCFVDLGPIARPSRDSSSKPRDRSDTGI